MDVSGFVRRADLLDSAVGWIFEVYSHDYEDVIRVLHSWDFTKEEILNEFDWADEEEMKEVNEIIRGLDYEY